jgi:hypothetical protein
MKQWALAAGILFSLTLSGVSAEASTTNSTVFPPDHCSANELRVIAWRDSAPSTYCVSGQEVLRLALPNCGDGERVVYRYGRQVVGSVVASGSGSFGCEADASYLPTCSEDERLTSDGEKLACKPISGECTSCSAAHYPTCGTDEVLTSLNGATLACVKQAVAEPPMRQICRTVTNVGASPLFVSFARCADDEQLMSGGGRAEVPGGNFCGEGGQGVNMAFIHDSFPMNNGWVVDAYRFDRSGDACSEAFAICCKMVRGDPAEPPAN